MICEKEKYEIVMAGKDDLPAICHLFDAVIKESVSRGYQTWNNIDEHSLLTDIENGHQYQLLENNGLAGVFTVQFEDRLIWQEMENEDSLYLHRIAISPDQKGKKLFDTILDWAIRFAKKQNRSAIRMDTWADNQRLIAYYRQFGFRMLGISVTPNHIDLPAQNRNLTVALLERTV